MLRKTITTALLLFAGCFSALLADDQPTKEPVSVMLDKLVTPSETPKTFPNDVETLGIENATKMTPAVHLNPNGVEYGSNRKATDTVNRLRSARDSVLLPSKAKKITAEPKTAKKNTNEAIESFLGASSRRRKPAKVIPKVTPPTSTTVEAPTAKKVLSSVMTPAQPKAPTLATPKVNPVPTLAPAQTPQLAAPSTSPQGLSLQAPQAQSTPAKAQLGSPNTALAQPQPPARQPVKVAQKTLTPPKSTQPLASPIELNPEIPFTNINIGPATTVPATQPAPVTPTTPRSAMIAPIRSTPAVGFGTSSNTNKMRSNSPRTQPSQNRASKSKSTTTKSVAKQNTQSNQPVLLSNRSPALIVKTHGQQTIRVGRVATYYITAANAGDLAAEDVVVSINVPNWAELTRNQASTGVVRVEPNSNGDNVMRWSIRNLQPNGEQRLRIDLVPRASRPIELGVTWNFKSVSAMAQIEVQEPKLQISVVGPSDIQFGETKLYTITVSNPGTGDAENVSLTLLPINDGSGVPSTRELGSIKAGARRTIEVELTARQAGDLAVRAQATADGNLKDNAKQDVRVRRANLVVEAVGPAKKFAGTPARYTVKVTNNGDATAHDVIAVAALPMSSKYVKSSNAGAYDEERGRVRWSIGSLRPGAFQVVEVTTVLTGAGSNKLEVRAAGANKLAAAGDAITVVESRPDLKLSVEDPAGVIAPGTEMTYEVHIVNRGTKAATDVNVVGFFSEGIEPIAIHGWRGDVEVGQVNLQPIPNIAPGQEIILKVIAKASRAGNHVFRAELSTKSPLTKLAVEEWTVFHSDESKSDLEGASVQQADGDSLEPATQTR